jgi:hypothetical protein
MAIQYHVGFAWRTLDGLMAAGRCVHCLASVEKITEDHLFPRSWYPQTTPLNLEKWTIPACEVCNKEYGRTEETLRLRLAACVDPKSAASAGVWKKALDSINPARGRNPFDTLKRRLARQKFLNELRSANDVPKNYLLPEINPDRPVGNIALLLPARHINRFITKLVRGTVYLTERRYIEDEQEIFVSLLKKEDGSELLQILQQFGELYEREPGIRIRKAVAEDGRTNALFVFDIWEQFRFYGMVVDRNL